MVEYDGWPNGLKIHRDGCIFVADYNNGILMLDPESGTISPFLTHNRSEGFKGVNDLIFNSKGKLYFTDQGQTGMHDPSGRVFSYCLDTQQLTCLIRNGPSPNGLVLSPDEKTLYVPMTRGNAVWRLPILTDGNLFVCDAGNGCVWTFSHFGEPLYRIRSCTEGRTTTNLAFGGEGNRSLFITDSSTGAILRAELDAPGQPMFSHSAVD